MTSADKNQAPSALPVAPWMGGKRILAKRLCEIIDTHTHATYVEPFVGMGGVFLRRSLAAKCEVINDYSKDVSNLFRMLQRHYPQFIEYLRFQLTTRYEFDRLKRTDPTTLTDLERAARFLYLQRTSFGGKVVGQTFGVSKSRPARFNLTSLEPMLEDLHARLSGVTVECLPYEKVIERYDTHETLFYLDPPYVNGEEDYGKGMFERSDYERLENCLGSIKGAFIMSLNDVDLIRDLFSKHRLYPVTVRYTVGTAHGERPQAKELIITNFDVPALTDV